MRVGKGAQVAVTVGVRVVVAVGLGVLLSTSAILLEEISYKQFSTRKELLRLFVFGFMENFGYRQINLLWRLSGLLHWLFGTKAKWGSMPRSASWQQSKP